MHAPRQRLAVSLPDDLAADLEAARADWHDHDSVRRLWAGDPSLWTGSDEGRWLGWLGIVDAQLARIAELQRLGRQVADEDFTHAVVLGMGGSSLCPEVLGMTFGAVPGHPELLVLDSTDPAQVRRIEARLDLERTVFIVSSKSGSTLEPDIFRAYFFDRVRSVVGGDAGRHFVAVTDPGSQLQMVAERNGFREIAYGVPSVGGRYSALSNFGMVPAAVMGLDVRRLIERGQEMVRACGADVPASDNPGLTLGLTLGLAARRGADKVTFVASPGIADLGAWLEQLLAESTGKQGLGLIPCDGERVAGPDAYGSDRLFVYLRLDDAADETQDAACTVLEEAGYPVLRVGLRDAYDLGAEFFRWEFATAVAGAVLGINPFDQPDVEASKVATRALTEAYETSGTLPAEVPFTTAGALTLYADPRNAEALREAAGGVPGLSEVVRAHLHRLDAGDYFALLAYVDMCDANSEPLQAIRHAVRRATGVATCLGFGPRFLHSTGQAYKGGPDSGVFLQVTCDDAVDLPVPGRRYSFGVVKAAQARGDLEVLAERGRRALRVHVGPDVQAGLQELARIVEEALVVGP